MTQFQATLIAAGDPDPLPTTVELNQGKLVIESNGQAIGDWPVSDLEFERIVGGFKVTLDGEVAVLKLTESDEFNAELRRLNEANAGTKTRRKADPEPRARKEKRPEPKARKEKRPELKAAKKEKKSRGRKTPEVTPVEVVAEAPPETISPLISASPEAGAVKESSFFNRLDGKLEAASKRWNKYVPDWIFTRGGVVVGLVLLVAVILMRDIFSAIFLILAAVGLITSAIALMDQVIATRIFRGGFTPIHGLLGSLGLVLLGLVLGLV